MNKNLYSKSMLAFVFAITFMPLQARDTIKDGKVSLMMENVTLRDVLKELEKQTQLTFFYSTDGIDTQRKIKVSLDNVNLEDALHEIFKGTGISYSLSGGHILLRKEKRPGKSRKKIQGDVEAQMETVPEPSLIQTIESEEQVAPVALISGRIMDENNQPLPGVNIVVKGTTNGTTTDADGKFAINVPDENAVLSISFIGYASQEILVGNRTEINISLTLDVLSLQEVIVIGYGTVEKKDITGSVSKANMSDIQKAPVRSFDEALAGRLAGVVVSSSDGQPGISPNIVIRGNNSLTQSNSPLYVIDGFPIEGPNNNVIDPADIESIEVLKDASATAIYGARGANGVILITTKKGIVGKSTITFNASFGEMTRIKKQQLMSAYEFVKLSNEKYPTQTAAAYFTNGRTLDSYADVKGIDWEDKIIQAAQFSNYSIALRGGSEGTTYSISGSAINQEGIVINSGFERYQGKIAVDQKVSSKLKAGVNLTYSNTRFYGTRILDFGTTDRNLALMSSVWGYRPVSGKETTDLENDNLDEAVDPVNDYRYNPVKNVKNILNETAQNTLIAIGTIDYSVLKNLTLKFTGGTIRELRQNNVFYNSSTRNGDRNTVQGVNGPNGSITNTEIINYNYDATATYKKKWKQAHDLTFLVGASNQKRTEFTYGYSANNVPNEILGISGLDEGVTTRLTSALSASELNSFLSRVSYNYKSRYYLTASYRADGSSKFQPANRWGYFPSAALSWRFTNEKFMEKLSFINEGKLRVSYGLTGNNRVTDYAYLAATRLSNGYYSFNNVLYQGLTRTALSNTDLKWETTAQINIGLDLELMKGRVELNIDYYNKLTSDLLLNAQLPLSTGFNSTIVNIGKIQNEGMEFTLNTVNLTTTKFTWSSNFNISFNQGKIVELVDGQESILNATGFVGGVNAYMSKIGQPVGQLFGYVFDGLYQPEDFYTGTNGTPILKNELPGNGGTRSGIRPGNIKYKDLNGDGVIDSKDQTVIGRGTPIHTGGFSNNFKYQGFDLNIFFQWSFGNDIMNANRITFEGGGSSYPFNTNQFASYANRWSEANQNSNIPISTGVNGPTVYSSRIVESGSYLRLKTVQLGYTVPATILKRARITSLYIYGSAQNLITWTNYSGMDPEVSTLTSPLTPGFDYSAYPRAKTITVGIKLTL
jgi:TonB-dependent starch-binding outer membrane protein SusC